MSGDHSASLRKRAAPGDEGAHIRVFVGLRSASTSASTGAGTGTSTGTS